MNSSENNLILRRPPLRHLHVPRGLPLARKRKRRMSRNPRRKRHPRRKLPSACIFSDCYRILIIHDTDLPPRRLTKRRTRLLQQRFAIRTITCDSYLPNCARSRLRRGPRSPKALRRPRKRNGVKLSLLCGPSYFLFVLHMLTMLLSLFAFATFLFTLRALYFSHRDDVSVLLRIFPRG